jgi:YgiT-type zinc finger domain-containing protein
MKCAVCHQQMLKKKGELDLRIKGKLYLVRNVVYDECPHCGERVLSPNVSQELFTRITRHEFVEETVKIPVLDGIYA